MRATKIALKLADYVVTEAGFGADLGAEKFLDIKCRMAGLVPDTIVIVATVRAIKYNGGVPKGELSEENLEALKKGIVNLDKHIENMQNFGVNVVVTLNSFITDTEAEQNFVREHVESLGCEFAIANVWAEGGEGGRELAGKVLKSIDKEKKPFTLTYDDNMTLKEKINAIAVKIYGADGVSFSASAENMLYKLERMGFGRLPVCMAKTQYSLSDNPELLGRPEGFTVNVREVYVSAGAGFVVALTGTIMTMPGLPKIPAAERIDFDERTGKITGLF